MQKNTLAQATRLALTLRILTQVHLSLTKCFQKTSRIAAFKKL
jgi:hypothetical protein